LEDESPDRMPRRMTASSLCLSVAVVKPHHAYSENFILHNLEKRLKYLSLLY